MGKSQITNHLSTSLEASKSQTRKFKIKKLFLAVLLMALAVSIYYMYCVYNRMPKKATIAAEIPSSIKVNQKMTLPIFIDTAGLAINAAEVYLKFDPKALEIKSVSKENSFFQLWITDEPKFNNEKGEISFAGGLPNPGFQGKGQVGKVVITPLKSGWHSINFDRKTRVLLNDGKGSEISLILKPIKIKVK